MCQSTHWYTKANSKYIKNYDKNIASLYLTYFGRAMSQKLRVNRFKWVNDLSRFNKEFIKNYI